ncbi:Hypothetical predicted protein [Lecanosticta acicola]|uniref:Uncharacterized protein n=1 Tax=Lecanosticta acicola TaxID=111012 RepID=A0AAI8YYC5_9PEZI|nr:Hypothetical predicted protein [Lecanosticta acicola]
MASTLKTIEHHLPDDDYDSDEIVVKQPTERVPLRPHSTNTRSSSPATSDHIKLQSHAPKPQRVTTDQTENQPPDDEYDSDEIVVTRPSDASAPSRQSPDSAPPEKPAIPSKRKTSAPNTSTKRKTPAPKTYSKKKYPRKTVEEPQVLEVSPVATRTAPAPATPAAPPVDSDSDAEVSGVESVLPSGFQPRTAVTERETPTPLPPAAEPSPRTLRSQRKVPAASSKARETANSSRKRKLNNLSAVVEEDDEDNINVKSAATNRT